MPPENRSSAEEPFSELDTQLAALRAAAKSLREERPSRTDNLFHPGRRARREADFGAAVVAALKEIGASVRKTLAQQESKITELDRRLSDFRDGELANFQSQLKQVREHHERLAHEQAEAVRKATELREHHERLAHEQAEAMRKATELREQVEQFGRDQAAKVEQLAAGQKDLANEFRERLQHLLDEQRIALRQLALKTSEDAVLADRARRATELKLEELAKRLPPAPPA